MKTGKRLVGLLTAVLLVVTLCVPLAMAEGDAPWVAASDWALPELEEILENNLYPDKLAEADLTESITREEFAAVTVKLYEELSGESIEPAPDTTFTDSTDEDVLKAFAAGIVGGTSAGKFTPDSLLTREQAATMLARVYKALNWDGWTLDGDAAYKEHTLDKADVDAFPDDARISSWAKDAVYFMGKYEVIRGTTTGLANPLGNASREQALAMSLRMFGAWDDIEDGPAVAEPSGEELLKAIVEEAQSQISELEELFGGILKIGITVRGDSTLVYTYTLLEDVPGMDAAAIEEAMGVMESVLDPVIALLKEVGVTDASIVVEWFDHQGKQLFSKEYK